MISNQMLAQIGLFEDVPEEQLAAIAEICEEATYSTGETVFGEGAKAEQAPPFDVKQEYVTSINGVLMETYIDWMKSCYFISLLGLPAISVPCGFTEDGLPVGVQIVGRHQDDFGVLQLAYAFEQATGFGRQQPDIAL